MTTVYVRTLSLEGYHDCVDVFAFLVDAMLVSDDQFFMEDDAGWSINFGPPWVATRCFGPGSVRIVECEVRDGCR